MMNLEFIRALLFGDPLPPVPNLRSSSDDRLPDDGLTMGTLVIGKPGSGKTSWLAQHILDYALAHPKRAIFALDASGSLKDTFFELVARQSREIAIGLTMRAVNDELGNPNTVIPLPEFSPAYRTTAEEQIQRVAQNLRRLAPYLVQQAPVIGGTALNETAPELFRLLTAVTNEHGECWQITEGKKLLIDTALLRTVCTRFGDQVPQAKWFFQKEFLNKDVTGRERDLRTYTLRSMLGLVESREVRARVGYYRPGWTPAEAIEKGLIVFISGENLTNQSGAQHYLFTQAYSMIIAEVNKRRPNDPKDEPVLLVIDETASLLEIEGMAEEIGKVSPLYRSRKLELMVVIQALSQLERDLKARIWNLGNIVCFSLHDVNDAYEVAQQLLSYGPTTVKLDPNQQGQHPIMEPDRGQYLQAANWIQRLEHRQCVIRRYFSERQLDQWVRFVRRTRDLPKTPVIEPVSYMKERLLRERGVSVRDALEVVNQRNLFKQETPPTL